MNSSESAIVEALLEFVKTLGLDKKVFQTDPLVGDLLRDEPFAFLLAASVDRMIKAETAWRIPDKIRLVLGHLDPCQMAEMSEQKMYRAIQQIDGKPRYPRSAAKTFISAGRLVCKRFGGDTRKIWKNRRSLEIRSILQEIHGIGAGIASMVVIILERAKEIELLVDDYAFMDIKPDVHTKRVLKRLGMMEGNGDDEAVLAARRLFPSYPGKLDTPLWEIGRRRCRPKNPDCSACEMNKICPKNI